MQQTQPKIPGVSMTLSGEAFIVPALSIAGFEEYEDRITRFPELTKHEQFSLVLDVAHRAMVRNYPDMTRERLGDLLDPTNVEAVFLAVMNMQVAGQPVA